VAAAIWAGVNAAAEIPLGGSLGRATSFGRPVYRLASRR
jgi:hypothetical protein